MKTVFAAAAILMASQASAAQITATFDSDLEGWGATGGAITHIGTGGNGGGYAQLTDTVGTFMQATASSAFTGNLSAYDGGTFSFDGIQTAAPSGNYIDGFGEVTIGGSGGTATLDIFPDDPNANWMTGSTAFTAAAFGVAQSTWDAILADVTVFQIEGESWSQIGEVVGFDNITLTSADHMAPVPLPAGGLLLLGGLAGIAALRGRRA